MNIHQQVMVEFRSHYLKTIKRTFIQIERSYELMFITSQLLFCEVARTNYHFLLRIDDLDNIRTLAAKMNKQLGMNLHYFANSRNQFLYVCR